MTIWKLKIWKETLIWGPPFNATIDVNNVLSQRDVLLKKLDFNHRI
jgi:hypothetical protein